MTYPDTPDARLSAMARIIDTLTEHATAPVASGAATSHSYPPEVVAPNKPLDAWGSNEIAQITAMTPDQVARLLEGQI